MSFSRFPQVSSSRGITAVGTPARAALSRTYAFGLLQITILTAAVVPPLKCQIIFSAFVPLPEANIARLTITLIV